MKRLVVVWVASGILAACGGASTSNVGVAPVRVETIPNSDMKQIVLTPRAVQRLGIETAPIVDVEMGGTRRGVVPSTALLFAPGGEPSVFTNPAPLTFVRQIISVDRIDGDRVILLLGPPSGAQVVTVGSAELLGAEMAVG